MSRKSRIQSKLPKPDATYNSRLVTLLISRVLQSGKKSISQKIVYNALKIISKFKSIEITSFLMHQVFEKNNEIISEAEVRLVTINKQGKPIQIPKVLEVKFKEYLSN